jgi:carboxynorspermidine decarboxylase
MSYPFTPAFVLDENRLVNNLQLIDSIRKQAGIEIILALKGFSMWSVFPLIKQYLGGATASSLNEAKLINEYMNCKAHTYCAAYIPGEFNEIVQRSSHLVFNSIGEFERYKSSISLHPDVSFGLRVNPGYSEVGTDLYNPVLPGSRLGVSPDWLTNGWPKELEGIHFHSLCENNSLTLEKTLQSFEKLYGHFLPQIKWVNMGGGHLMTHKEYDKDHLINLLIDFKSRHNVDIILEPGSAIAWQTGYLCSTVLDIVENAGTKTLMMDISFTAHMPDTLEMPYRPAITGASDWDTKNPFSYRIGGMSCLSGDFMFEYSFDREINVGDVLIFEDMMHYTMVKTTTFNGVGHPSIVIQRSTGDFDLIKKFDYMDFKSRLS